jgi:hypothetical protein
MSETQPRPTLAKYTEAVAAMIESGETFGDVEDAIDDLSNLSMDQKAALWLFAFSLRPPAAQRLQARTHLSAVQ